jgi:50S ribosomal protein uL30
LIAVIRIRGTVNIRKDFAETLKRLNLRKPNHCVVLPDVEPYISMINKVRHCVAYGIIDLKTLKELLKKRGEMEGMGKLNENNVKLLGFSSIDELAEALYKGKVSFKEIPRLKKVFRLNPPSKGYKSIKKPYPEGSFGDWGSNITSLIEKML